MNSPVQDSPYIERQETEQGSADEDVGSHIGKENEVFVQLYSLWRNKNISVKMKLRIYTTNVTSVLLYGSET